MYRRLTVLSALVLALGASSCIHSYRSQPALEFAQIPYRSLQGKCWPVKRVALTEVPRSYGMKQRELWISYVELNPQAAQAVVFVHGLGSNLKFWRYQLDLVASKGYRVLALDLPGYGKSDKPASFPYTMEAMADVVRELLTELKITQPILVGHSMGGQTVLSYAIRYPKEVLALVLTSPAGFEDFSANDQRWFEKVFTSSLIKKAGEYDIWGSTRYNNFYRWKPEYAWLIEERVRLSKAKEFDSYAYANVKSVHGLCHNDFVRENLRKIKTPTLVLYGDKDRLIPNRYMHGGFTGAVMKRGAGQIPGAKLVPLAGCGHMLQMDCSARYNQRLQTFLAQNRR